MSAATLWAELVKAGVVLYAEGEALGYDAPVGGVTAPMVALLRAEKAPLLALVSGTFRDEIQGWGPGLRDLFDERAALLEYDGGMQRTEAERAAYLEVREHLRVPIEKAIPRTVAEGDPRAIVSPLTCGACGCKALADGGGGACARCGWRRVARATD